MASRDEIIALVVSKARAAGEVPWEILGGAIAESGLNPTAERWGMWPDVSFGLWQQTVRFADEGDHTASAENIALIQSLYSDPEYAATVAIAKFKAYRVQEATALDAWCRYNWPSRVPAENPNRANYARGLAEAQAILGAAPMPVTYNKTLPAIPQNDPWSCAPTSTRWALTAIGRHPDESWMESTMLADGIVTKEDGLLDSSGAHLAAWIQAQYNEFGYLSNSEPSVSFEWAAAEGGHAYPVLLGGHGWGHWSGLRDYDPLRDLLLLANPAEGWQGVGQTMDRSQFDALGPFSAVRIWHPDLIAPESVPAPVDPPPPLPPIPPTMTLEAVVAGLKSILGQSDADHAARSIRADVAALVDKIGA